MAPSARTAVYGHKALNNAPLLKSRVAGNSGFTTSPIMTSRSLNQQQYRSFWWRRNAAWASCLDADFQKHIERRHRILKHKYAQALYRKSTWDLEQPSDQSQPQWGWRLASSWGKSGGRWISVNELPQDKEKVELKQDGCSRQERVARRIEDIKKQVDEDPFGAIFGKRFERSNHKPGISRWSPLNWGCAETQFRPEVVGHVVEPQEANTPFALRTSRDVRPASTVQYDASVVMADDYEFDPISMRKLPKSDRTQISSDMASIETNDQASSIPVKTFGGNPVTSAMTVEKSISKDQSPAMEKPNTLSTTSSGDLRSRGLNDFAEASTDSANRSSRDWLSKEGFGRWIHRAPVSDHSPRSSQNGAMTSKHPHSEGLPGSSSQPNYTIQQHSAAYKSSSPTLATSKRQLKYDVEESKVEDLDLLRPSDVRAASGVTKRQIQQTEAVKRKKREDLENDYDKTVGNEIYNASQGRQTSSSGEKGLHKPASDRTDAFGYDRSPQGLELSYANELENRVQTLENSYAAEIEEQEADRFHAEVDGFDRPPKGLETSYISKNELNDRLETSCSKELKAHKAAVEAVEVDGFSKEPQGLETSFAREMEMRGEGDMSANVIDFATRDRWYKKKAPHAEAKKSQKLRDRQLIRQIRGIYEDSYGVIDTKHQQGVPKEEKQADIPLMAALNEYEGSIGANAYEFTAGSYPLEQDILAQAKSYIIGGPVIHEESRYGSPEELAMRWEEAEQMLHEEVAEGANVIHEVRSHINHFDEMLSLHERLKKSANIIQDLSREIESVKTSQSSIIPLAEADAETQPHKIVVVAGYVILAYDPATKEITSAETVSSSPSSISSTAEKVLSPSEVLLRLSHPAKFLPYISPLKESGFQIISGKGDVLIFKKIDEGSWSIDQSAFVMMFKKNNPTTTPDGPTFPRGPVQSNTIFPPSLLKTATPPSTAPKAPTPSNQSSEKVKREEDVFSGSSRRWEDGGAAAGKSKQKGPFRRATRRVFWVGVWTAGCCYAVGVVAEYFRTGGSSGLGPQGF
ncbi:MAG: hypothetical protein M1827_003900 [Pycnora praestabilis]|nr:MAG: hypothetical protein M1827_003900 [Pycnora praestabilis]